MSLLKSNLISDTSYLGVSSAMAYSVCAGHDRSIMEFSYSPDPCGGSLLLSASRDSRAILRDGENGDWIRTFVVPEQASPVTSCSLTTATASRAATASKNNANVWDIETGQLLHVIQCRKGIRTCAFSKNGKELLTGGRGNAIRIFDLDHQGSYPEIFSEQKESQQDLLVDTAAWLQDDRFILASSNHEWGASIWDRRSSKICATLDTKATVASAEVNQGYITIAAGSTVTFWDVTNFRCLFCYVMPCSVQSASLYGNKFIAGGDDEIVYLFDLHTGKEIGRSCFGDFGDVCCLRFSPDGKSYASGFSDGTVIIKKL